jgi:hypothetical protein
MKAGLYIIEDNYVVCGGEEDGAILMDDELWHPFRYFGNGEKEIHTDTQGNKTNYTKIYSRSAMASSYWVTESVEEVYINE